MVQHTITNIRDYFRIFGVYFHQIFLIAGRSACKTVYKNRTKQQIQLFSIGILNIWSFYLAAIKCLTVLSIIIIGSLLMKILTGCFVKIDKVAKAAAFSGGFPRR